MPNSIYPDLSNTPFDIKYHELKVLASDVRRRVGPRVTTGTGEDPATNPDPGGGGGGAGGDPPGGVPPGCKKVYRANLTGSDPGNPVVTVFENGIGPITWTRDTAGFYIGTSAGLFPVGGTWWMLNNPLLEAMSNPSTDTYIEIRMRVVDDSTVIIITRNVGLNENVDLQLSEVSVEITTYCNTVSTCIAVSPLMPCCDLPILSITPTVE